MRNSRSVSGKWSTAAASIIPRRTVPDVPVRCRSGPTGEVARQAEDLAGVSDGRGGARPQQPTTTVAFEQVDAEAPFEFGEPLRQGRSADANGRCRGGPGGLFVDGDEVLQLADGEVG